MIKSPTEKTTLTEYDRQLIQGVPFLNGKEVTVNAAASFAQQKLPHGLGRPYRGAFTLWNSTLSRLVIHDPSAQTDADVNITVTDVSGIGGNTRLWVF